jgi:LPXTG-site transpeptidase (sortase) family protein
MRVFGAIITALLGFLSPFEASFVYADPALSITPITWNVVGLDSNNVTVGPNVFPVGARICNDGSSAATNVQSTFTWTETTNQSYIFLRPNTNSAYTDGVTLEAGECADFYYEIEVKRDSASYDKSRSYQIGFTADGGLSGATPDNREIYVEHLVSQNRNAVIDISVDGESVPAGGTMTFAVGNTYDITLYGQTSTAYNQLESFINISNTVFRINSVHSTYSTVSDAPPSSDLLYADSCGWDNDVNSPTYMSCVVSDGKSGGNVTVEYNVTILSGIGSTQDFTSMFYDYSGSSFHYNADFSRTARLVTVISPVSISKSFLQKSVTAGSTTTVQFTLTNPTTDNATNIYFEDALPSLSGSQMTVAADPSISLSAGCLAGSSLTANPGGSSVTFSGGVQASSSCVIQFDVDVPATPESGTYTNTSGSLFVNETDTELTGSANLTVAPTTNGVETCDTFTLATWTMPDSSNPPSAVTLSGITATATAGSGITTLIDAIGTNSWRASDFEKGATLNLANQEYLQFSSTITGYTNIGFKFDARLENAQLKGPHSLALYYSTDGTNFTAYGTTISPTAAFVTYNQAFPGNTTGKSTIYFRIYAYDPGNPGNADYLYVDNVSISGYQCATPDPAEIGKAFSSDIIAEGGTSTLTFTLSNPNDIELTQAAFTDSLPSGLEVASPANIDNRCGGTFNASAALISLEGGTIPVGGCTISLDVTGAMSGTYVNNTGNISTYESGTNTGSSGSASATLNIVSPLVFSKSFSPNPIYADETSTLTFTIANPNSITIDGVTMSDTLYDDGLGHALLVANPSGAVTSGCNINSDPAFSLTAAAGSGSISLANGSIGAGKICKITVRVTSDAVLDYPNTASLTTSVEGLTIDDASDTLAVIDHYPGLSIIKQVALSPDGPWSSYLTTAAGADVYYRIQVENVGDVALNNLSISDPDLDLSGCNWPGTLPAASATQDPTVSCIAGPETAISSGEFTNTASASGTYSGVTYSDEDSATYAISELQIDKSATESSFSAAGDEIHYLYLVTNTGAASLAGPVSVSDTRATVICPNLTTIGNEDSLLDQDESITCSATYTVTEADVTAGFVTNAAYALVDSARSNTDRLTIASNQPDLVVSKKNNVNGFGEQGSAFTWTIKVQNTGGALADFASGQIILSDSLPAGAEYVLAGPSDTAGIGGSGSISCAIDTLVLTCSANGGNVTLDASSGTFTVTLTVTPTTSGTFANTAVVDPNDNIANESNESNNSSTNSVYVSSSVPSIELSKTASPSTYIAADSVITYDYVITNTGTTTLTGTVSVTDDKTTVTCDPLPAGGLEPLATLDCSASYTITQTDMDNGSVTNLATAAIGEVSSEEVSETVTAEQNGELTLLKTAAESSFNAVGDVLHYTLTVTNTGNLTLTAVSITDGDISDFACDPEQPLTLAPGEELQCTGTYTITQTDLNNGSYTNGATASGSDPSSTAVNTEDEVTVNADQNPNLSLTKVAAESYFMAVDDVLHFTVTAKNTGNVALSNVSISDDDLPDLGCTPEQPATLAPDATLVCSGTHTITADDVTAGSYTNHASVTGTAPDSQELSKSTQESVYLVTPASLGLAKDLVSITKVSAGTYDVVFDILIKNYGDSDLSDLQVTDDLAATFPPDNTFTVQSVSGSGLDFNSSYDGSTDTDLLAAGNIIGAGAEKTITLTVRVVPLSSGPFENSAQVSATHAVFGAVTDLSQDGTDPDPDSDEDPTNNNESTAVTFEATLFDPPYGIKRFDSSGAPYLEWTMIWINDSNIVDVQGKVSDPLPENTEFFVGTTSSGYPLPAGTPDDSTNMGISCTSSAGSSTDYCYYEGPTPEYERGRIIWEGTVGPDYGVTNPSDAHNAIYITFGLTVLGDATAVTNTATFDLDRNGDGDVLDAGEVSAASASKIWDIGTKELPATGFAPGVVTLLPEPTVSDVYTQFDDLRLEIPLLGIDLPVVGIPQTGNGSWDLTWLNGSAGWLQGSAFPTWNGNSVITAHVFDANGQAGPFVGLNQLKWGDTIILHFQGQPYVYSVREVLDWVRPDDLAPLRHEELPWLTLITCKGYDPASGKYDWRYVVRAVQIEID